MPGIKPRSHLVEYFFRLFATEINLAIANNLEPIGIMKLQCETVYPNIYECVFDYMKIYHDRFWTFADTLWIYNDKMRTVSEKYVDLCTIDNNLFSTETDRFQVVHDCSVVSIVKNREILGQRLKAS